MVEEKGKEVKDSKEDDAVLLVLVLVLVLRANMLSHWSTPSYEESDGEADTE